MMKYFFMVLLGLGVLSASCKIEYRTEPVAGTIAENAFVFVDGYIDSDGHFEMYKSDKDFSTDLFDIDYPFLMGTINPVVGEKDLAPPIFDFIESYTLTGIAGAGNPVTFSQGTIEITSVSDTQVSGKLHIMTDTDELDGTFTLERVSW